MDKDYVSIRRLGRFLTQLKGLFVQEVSGKGLSTEDYTTEEKTKLAGIASGAEVNVIEGVQVNGADLTPDANRKVNVVVPENVAHKVTGATSGNFAALNAQGDLTDSGKDASDFGSAADVEAINEKIPTQASAGNQLADKAFVNSTVQYNTANARGNWENQFVLPMTATAGDYPVDYAGSYKPSQNDYMVLRDASIWLSFEAQLHVYLEPGVCFLRGSDIYVIDEAEELEIIASHKIAEMGKYEDVSADTVVLDMTASKDFVYPYQGKYYARLVDQVGEETFDITDTTKWCEINDGRPSEEITEGTWFFKYSGNWNTANIGGWIPMFQVNEKPLTAAQVAALNSNITAALTSKLQGLPSKPVDTAAQTLSDAEKARARTNIGATAPEVFMATYGTTTYEEIISAYNAGKVVLAKRTSGTYNYVYYFAYMSSTEAAFICLQFSTNNFISVSNADTWASATVTLERSTNKVTSLSASSTDNEYPAAKCVYDNLYKPGKVSQTITWSGSGASAEYTLSDIVTGNVPVALIEEAAVYGVFFNTTTGYFEYGGYTDIAADEMREAIAMRVAHIMRQAYQTYGGRIILPPMSAEDGAVSSFYNVKYVKYIPACIITESRTLANNQFAQSKKLEEVGFIIGGYSWPTTPFGACESLKSFKVNALIVSISVPDSPLITVECIKYIVDKRTNTASPVTITLHATAYARMAADTTEYTYGGQTYTGIVAYANAKNITIASV